MRRVYPCVVDGSDSLRVDDDIEKHPNSDWFALKVAMTDGSERARQVIYLSPTDVSELHEQLGQALERYEKSTEHGTT